jgi:hypothetical protein
LVLVSGGDLYLAVLTSSMRDAETKDNLDVSINIDGRDVVSQNTLQWAILRDDMIHRGSAAIAPVPNIETEPISFDSALLTNSSVRVGITGSDMWVPEDVLLIGPEAATGHYIPLAGEWDIDDKRISTDPTDGSPGSKLTIPLRLVPMGNIGTVIRRVSLLVKTSHIDDAGSENPIRLEIMASGTQVLNQVIDEDRFEKSDNWYTLDVEPFIKRNVMSNGRITLSIRGRDAWRPRRLFLFGFDTAEGRPSAIVPLVSVREWEFGNLSEDTTEGRPSIDLPIS